LEKFYSTSKEKWDLIEIVQRGRGTSILMPEILPQ
jgi:hypothetical protein